MLCYFGKYRNLIQEEQEKFIVEGRKLSICFCVLEGKIIVFNDIVKGEILFELDGIGDFVIVKKDGMLIYNFVVVIDDYLMKMIYVLCGEDYIFNILKQIMIF